MLDDDDTAPDGQGADGEFANSPADIRRMISQFVELRVQQIEERKLSRAYYHGAQWTAEEIEKLRSRRQPATVMNVIAPKVNGIIGVMERLRSEPKAFPRTMNSEAAAELATIAIQYQFDEQRWSDIHHRCIAHACIDGIAGVEIAVEDRKNAPEGAKDIRFDVINPATFYHDPVSVAPDFSDAMYLGTVEIMDRAKASRLYPSADPDDFSRVFTATTDVWAFDKLGNSPDDADLAGRDRVEIIRHWYCDGKDWRLKVISGDQVIADDASALIDEVGDAVCGMVVFSPYVDHDGDRYGHVRILKPQQDTINHRMSRAAHMLNSSRLIVERGALDDPDEARHQANRADGVIEVNPGMKAEFDRDESGLAGNFDFYRDAMDRIAAFGPNPSLVGERQNDQSGRALQIRQQAGLAELGTYIANQTAWKLRLYRIVWAAIQRYWTDERAIAVTHQGDAPQVILLNRPTIDPETGQVVLTNSPAEIDVNITLDEGPDSQVSMLNTYETLVAMANAGVFAEPRVLLEMSPLPASVKDKVLRLMDEAQQRPPPEAQAAQAKLEADMQAQQMRMQADAAGAQAKLALEAEIARAKLAMERQKLDMEYAHKERMAILDLQIERERMMLRAQVDQARIVADAAIADAGMQQDRLAGT